ncbi:hypothetical protein F2P79_007721 [Pimephales promelas]|nr:hypothetical protein F2P79_007721 [Pimephales promelas]
MGGICGCTCAWADSVLIHLLRPRRRSCVTNDVSGFPELCFEPQSSSIHQPDTESGGTDMTDIQKETKKLDPKARVTFGSVGRKIGLRHIQLLD